MSYDPRRFSVALVAAGDPLDMRKFAGDRVHVYPQAAGTLTAEYALADEADACAPSDDWQSVQVVDACGDESVTDLSVEFTAEDVAGECSAIINCVRDYARFSVDVIAVGTRKSQRPAVNYACGPTIVPV